VTLGKQFVDFVAPKHQETALLKYKMRLIDEKIPKIPVEINAFLSSALGFLFSIGVLKSKYIIGGSLPDSGSEWLLFLSMDVEEVDKHTEHIPKAIMSVGRSLDFLEDNLDIKAKFTFFVTEKCAKDQGVIFALDKVLKSFGGRITIASHGSRHTSISKFSEEETIDFIRASKASLDSLKNRLDPQGDTFSIRMPAHSTNPHLLGALEREIEADIILFNTVYNPNEKITKNRLNQNNDLRIEINNSTPIYFPFYPGESQKILQVPLTLNNLSAHALGYYSTETRLKNAIIYFIDKVKQIQDSHTLCAFP
jgi:hypothetical protein